MRKQNCAELTGLLGQCVPITPGRSMASTEGEEFTHFLSIEIRMDEHLVAFQKDLMDLQSKEARLEGINLEQLTLRERKSGVAIKDPLLTMKLF